MTSRLELLATLAGQVRTNALALELALSEAYAQGESAALRSSGSVPAPGNPSSSSAPTSATGSMLAALAGTLVQDYVRTNFPGVLPPAPPVKGSSSAREWCSDNPELLAVVALEFDAAGELPSIEELEVARLARNMPSKHEPSNAVVDGFDTCVATGYRMALLLERLDVALVPGGTRG